MSTTNSLLVESASTLAVIASSYQPLLFLTGDLVVVAASSSFCRDFEIAPASVPGRPLSQLGNGEWAMPKLRSLLRTTASANVAIDAYEIDLIRKDHKPRSLLINAHKLDDGDMERVRLLVAVTDVTLARAEARQKDHLLREKDDLLRENAVLMREVQHRVANSLQIIASLLMQSARNVQSEEARLHLHDAHHRVMSIAAVQRHLAVASPGDIALRPYFVHLCESLGASMIFDPKRLSIATIVDDSVVKANVSVSLGLIITELIINALKHAFTENRSGKITINYRSDGQNWTLSVSDDGVGMPREPDKAKAGLGTGIVEALAKHLQSEIRVDDSEPGTCVTLIHLESAGRDVSAAA
jgi:two-component sensor histidine kinase